MQGITQASRHKAQGNLQVGGRREVGWKSSLSVWAALQKKQGPTKLLGKMTGRPTLGAVAFDGATGDCEEPAPAVLDATQS